VKYRYKVSASNPEGIDWIMNITHETRFTKKQFRVVVEDAFVEALEDDYKERGCAFASMVDPEKVLKFLLKKGFKQEKSELHYDFDPFMDCDAKNKKLLAWARNVGEATPPEYLKGAE